MLLVTSKTSYGVGSVIDPPAHAIWQLSKTMWEIILYAPSFFTACARCHMVGASKCKHIPNRSNDLITSHSNKLKYINSASMVLTLKSRVTHICVSKLTSIGPYNGLSPGRPQPYLNQYWNNCNLDVRNKIQWILKRNSCIPIEDNAFENVVCEMAEILSRPQCVNERNRITQGIIFPRGRSKKKYDLPISPFLVLH